MRVGNVSLLIPEGHEKDSGHVELAHGTVYTVKLLNHWTNRRCDATVTVDGKEVGCFRVNDRGHIVLERGVDDHGRFTFFKSDSEEAKAAKVDEISVDNRGLIQVVFKPEHQRVEYVYRGGPYGQSVGSFMHTLASAGAASCCSSPKTITHTLSAGPHNLSAGVTGLTGHSNQGFYSVASLVYDPSEEVTISLRLVCGLSVRPIESVKRGNEVPGPVGV